MSLKVTQAAPLFKETAVIGQEFKEISLEDYKGKYVVLFFYPLDFTFVCPTEILEFNKKLKEFEKRNVQIIGISTDSKFSHLAWKNLPVAEGGIGDIRYPLVADFNKTIAEDYGVLLDGGMALRGTFLIDKDGNLQHVTINNLDVGRNVDETLRIVDALQFTEKHGEVCPAGWNDGDDTMVPDPIKSKDYFSSHS
ncbi:MAG: peroxiredoxin [Candidatus Marinimicrobia bacterium]|nr:peroxiredoxin [Candidatus Neomarinimicrobiota bacterium]